MSEFKDKTPATMELHTDKFLETKNFSYAMSAFCRARANGYPIPEVILKCIEEAFLEWEKYDGEEPLDKILGINPGRGKKSVLREEWTKQRNERLFSIMATLIGLGWGVADAAEGACSWLREQYEANPTKYRYLKPSNAGRERDSETLLNSKTLADYWVSPKYRTQRKEGEQNALPSLILWSDEKKANYEKFMRKFINKTIKKKEINYQNYINKLITKV